MRAAVVLCMPRRHVVRSMPRVMLSGVRHVQHRAVCAGLNWDHPTRLRDGSLVDELEAPLEHFFDRLHGKD
jgi:hypothetical protein